MVSPSGWICCGTEVTQSWSRWQRGGKLQIAKLRHPRAPAWFGLEGTSQVTQCHPLMGQGHLPWARQLQAHPAQSCEPGYPSWNCSFPLCSFLFHAAFQIMIVPLKNTGLFLNPGPSGTFFSYYTAYLFLNIPLLSLLSQSSGVGGTKHLPRSRCCLVGPGVSGVRSSASFPLSPLIPKNLGFFTLAQLPLSQVGQVRRAACSDRAVGWVWVPWSLPQQQDRDTGASQPQRDFLQCREAQLEVPRSDQSLGDKGKDKQQDLIFTGQSLSRKNHPLQAEFGNGSGMCWVERG